MKPLLQHFVGFPDPVKVFDMNSDFFFDYNTGAMIVLDSDAVTIAVDQPLDVDAPNYSFVVQATEQQ